MQLILQDAKLALRIDEVPGPRPAIMKFKEFAPKKVLRLLDKDLEIARYFPDDALLPTTLFSDRVFTWGILFTLRQDWSEKYYEEVVNYHSSKPKAMQTKEIKVSDNWLAALSKFDTFTSGRSKQKNNFSILVKRDAKKAAKPRQVESFAPSDELLALGSQRPSFQAQARKRSLEEVSAPIFRRGAGAQNSFGFLGNSSHYKLRPAGQNFPSQSPLQQSPGMGSKKLKVAESSSGEGDEPEKQPLSYEDSGEDKKMNSEV